MILENEKLPPFEAALKRIMEIAFTSGLRALGSSGQKIEDIKSDEQARRRLLRSKLKIISM